MKGAAHEFDSLGAGYGHGVLIQWTAPRSPESRFPGKISLLARPLEHPTELRKRSVRVAFQSRPNHRSRAPGFRHD